MRKKIGQDFLSPTQKLDQKTDQKPKVPPVIPAAGKEQEKIAAIESQLSRVLEGEVEPRVEIEEIVPPEEQVVVLPAEVKKMGVQAVPPSTLPSDLAASPAVVVLPLTFEEIQKGLRRRVLDSIRWLAEWCWRLIKATHGRVKFAAKNMGRV